MLGGVEEHRGADAELTVALAENGVVDAALAALPERLVVGQVGKGHWLVAQRCVHLHHSSTAGKRENLGMRPACASQRECHVLDAFGDVQTTEVGVYDKTAGRHVLLVLPRLDVAETGKATVLGQRDDGFGLKHLLCQVLVCSLGDARATHFGGFGYCL